MADFDNLIRSDDFDEVERLLAKERAEKKTSKTEKKKSLMEMVAGSNDAAALARRLNVDPDMSEKVLVPLLNFLDKYGVGGAVAESPTAQAATGLFEFLGDITPVIKQSMDYFAGRQNELSQQDLDFLNQIKDAQTGDMDGLFIGETMEETSVAEPTPPPAPKAKEGEIPLDVDPFRDGVDWTKVVGAPAKETVIPETKPNEAYIQNLERLAAASGMSMDDVKRSDRQAKTNNFGRVEKEIDYSDAFNIDLGLEKINAAMNQEKNKLQSSSKIQFDESVPVPDSATAFDPLETPNYTTPSFIGTLQSVDQLAESAGVELDAPWVEEDYDPAEDDIGYDLPTIEPDEEVLGDDD